MATILKFKTFPIISRWNTAGSNFIDLIDYPFDATPVSIYVEVWPVTVGAPAASAVTAATVRVNGVLKACTPTALPGGGVAINFSLGDNATDTRANYSNNIVEIRATDNNGVLTSHLVNYYRKPDPPPAPQCQTCADMPANLNLTLNPRSGCTFAAATVAGPKVVDAMGNVTYTFAVNLQGCNCLNGNWVLSCTGKDPMTGLFNWTLTPPQGSCALLAPFQAFEEVCTGFVLNFGEVHTDTKCDCTNDPGAGCAFIITVQP